MRRNESATIGGDDLVVETIGNSIEKNDLQKLKQSLRGTFNTQTQGLLTQVSNRFQDK